MTDLERIKFVTMVFLHSAKSQMKKRDTLEMAAVIGLARGLKLDVKQTVKTGIVAFGIISAINGIVNVVENWEKIENL